jgi:WD40 repeat protein
VKILTFRHRERIESPFALLPKEVLVILFGYLGFKDLLSLALTSKNSLGIVNDPLLWEYRFRNDFQKAELPPELFESQDWRLLYRKHVTIRFNLEKGRPVSTEELSPHRKQVSFLKFTEDQRLLSASSDKTVQFLPTKNLPNEALTLTGPGKVLGLFHDNQNQRLTVGFSNNAIQCWHLGPEVQMEWEKHFMFESSGFRFTTEDIFSWNDVILRQWSYQGNLKNTFGAHTKRILVAETKGGLLASGSVDKTVRTWDLTQAMNIHVLSAHQTSVTALCLAPEEQLLISGSSDKTVKSWDLRSGLLQHTFSSSTGTVTCICKRDYQLITGSEDTCVRVWDLRKGETFLHKFACESPVTSLAADWRQIAVGLKSGGVKIFSFI